MRRFIAVAVLITFAACSSPEPAATVQPTARSLLPPTATPASPSPSASSDARSDGGGPAAADADPAPTSVAAAPAPTKPPTPTPKKPAEQPAISGQVLAAGQPVTDAQVTISGSGYHHNTTTSSQGRFRSATPPGTYTVTASSPSVSGCGAKTVTVESDAVSYVTITCSA